MCAQNQRNQNYQLPCLIIWSPETIGFVLRPKLEIWIIDDPLSGLCRRITHIHTHMKPLVARPASFWHFSTAAVAFVRRWTILKEIIEIAFLPFDTCPQFIPKKAFFVDTKMWGQEECKLQHRPTYFSLNSSAAEMYLFRLGNCIIQLTELWVCTAATQKLLSMRNRPSDRFDIYAHWHLWTQKQESWRFWLAFNACSNARKSQKMNSNLIGDLSKCEFCFAFFVDPSKEANHNRKCEFRLSRTFAASDGKVKFACTVSDWGHTGFDLGKGKLKSVPFIAGLPRCISDRSPTEVPRNAAQISRWIRVLCVWWNISQRRCLWQTPEDCSSGLFTITRFDRILGFSLNWILHSIPRSYSNVCAAKATKRFRPKANLLLISRPNTMEVAATQCAHFVERISSKRAIYDCMQKPSVVNQARGIVRIAASNWAAKLSSANTEERAMHWIWLTVIASKWKKTHCSCRK